MKKLIFLLFPFLTLAQNPTNFPYGIKNPAATSDSAPAYFTTTQVDGVHKKTPAATVEKTANKQNSLASDGTGTKYPTVDAVSVALTPEGTRLDNNFKWLWCWGDSLTAGAGGTPYPTTLAALTNFPVENRGVGGESSTQIKDRFMAETAHYNKSVIIWAGRNNYTTPATVKSDIATMVSALGHTRYLIVSILNADVTSEWSGGSDYNTIINLNNDLKALYGEKYVDLRAYLVSLHNNSAQDLIDFGHDIPPASLRFDHIHLNTLGYTKVAEYLNQKLGILLNQKSFLQAKDIDYYTITPFAPISTNYIPYISNNGKSISNSNIYYTGVEIGIGTTTPGAKLDVNGDIRIADNGQIAFGWGFAGVTGSSSTQSVGLFSWNGAGTTERLRATNSGAILINTFSDNLTDKLQVNGTVSASPATTSNQVVVKSQLDAKADLASPTFTGTPTAPTATAGTNTTQIATTAFVMANGSSSSATFTPTAVSGITFSRCYWIKNGNVLDVVYNFSITGNTSYSATMTLPNSFTINANSNGREIGGGKITTNSGYSRVQETATSSDIFLSIVSENTGAASGFARASVLIN